MAEVAASKFKYEPMPVDEWLDFKIEKEEIVDDTYEPGSGKKKLKLTILITQAGLFREDGKTQFKTFRDFGLYWPGEKSKKISKLFQLVAAILPERAIHGKDDPGYIFQTEWLLGVEGQLMMEEYIKMDGTDGQRILKFRAKPGAKAPKAKAPAKTPVGASSEKVLDI